jgi:hypothetical protein
LKRPPDGGMKKGGALSRSPALLKCFFMPVAYFIDKLSEPRL